MGAGDVKVEPVTTSSSRAPVPPTQLRTPRGMGYAALAAASVVATSAAGRQVTSGALQSWYPALIKPSFNPPNWVFPVAWTLLFAMMGTAFWRVLRGAPARPWRKPGIALFVAQLVLNVGWSAAFFGARSPVLGLVVIAPFWLAILATALAFRAVDRSAAWLLVPYLAWVTFATVLNVAIVHLN